MAVSPTQCDEAFICALIYGFSKVSNLVSKNVGFSDLTGEKGQDVFTIFQNPHNCPSATAELVKFILRIGASGFCCRKDKWILNDLILCLCGAFFIPQEVVSLVKSKSGTQLNAPGCTGTVHLH